MFLSICENLKLENNITMKQILTLCIIHDGDRVLLGMKKRGFGAGRWNGFGGKLGQGESVESAALRELQEECGISANGLDKRGTITFHSQEEPDVLQEVHIFSSEKFEGEPLETEEMRPQWFDKNNIPYDTMWPDDRYWMPLLLAGKNFEGEFNFKDNNTILNYSIKEI